MLWNSRKHNGNTISDFQCLIPLPGMRFHRSMNQHNKVVGPPNINPSHAIELKYTMITGIGFTVIKWQHY